MADLYDSNKTIACKFSIKLFSGDQKHTLESFSRALQSGRIPESAPVSVLLYPNGFDGPSIELSLELNRDLLSPNGTNSILKGEPFCFYRGTLVNRETGESEQSTSAAVNICDGSINGLVNVDGRAFYIIHNGGGSVIVTDSVQLDALDQSSNARCADFPLTTKRRWKRALGDVADYYKPYVDYKTRRYIQLIIVNDYTVYEKFSKNEETVTRKTLEVANYVNAIYAPLNIHVRLVHTETWSQRSAEPFRASSDSSWTLSQFMRYRRESLLSRFPGHDNAQFLTDTTFGEGVIGKAKQAAMCSREQSGGVCQVHSHHSLAVASTVAHEMGHNLGMQHDKDSCPCAAASGRCIMSTTTGGLAPTVWSECSVKSLRFGLEHGVDACLLDAPEHITATEDGLASCGNGLLDPGEECDCGVPELCQTTCCDPSTCKLTSGAKCGSGLCCDMDTCDYKPAATVCRRKTNECDLAEYCSGSSDQCPSDAYQNDGNKCQLQFSSPKSQLDSSEGEPRLVSAEGFCSAGKCGTHLGQCKLLWGETGLNSPDLCYGLNTAAKPSIVGNCGFDEQLNKFLPCTQQNALCGRLHCQHKNERPDYASASMAQWGHQYMPMNGPNEHAFCRAVRYRLGAKVDRQTGLPTALRDPGMVPDGAKCGVDKMCQNAECVKVSRLKTAHGDCRPGDCGANGACNNLGQCHCDIGFGGDRCRSSGPGGSIHSGPASPPGGLGFFGGLMLGVGAFLVLLVLAVLVYRWRMGRWPKGRTITMFLSPAKWDSRFSNRKNSRGRSKSPSQPRDTSVTVNNNVNNCKPSVHIPELSVPPVRVMSGGKSTPAGNVPGMWGAAPVAAVPPVLRPTPPRSMGGSVTANDISGPVAPVRSAPAPPPPPKNQDSARPIVNPNVNRQGSIRPNIAPPQRPERPPAAILQSLYTERAEELTHTHKREPFSAPPEDPSPKNVGPMRAYDHVPDESGYYDVVSGKTPNGTAPPRTTNVPPKLPAKPPKVANNDESFQTDAESASSRVAAMKAKFDKSGIIGPK